MRSKKRQINRLFIVFGVPVVSMGVTFFILYSFAPVQYGVPVPIQVIANSRKEPVAATLGPTISLPTRLQISSLNVDTTINPVGLTSEGAMDIDENPDQVAWYKLGAAPGQQGNAVIAGHYGSSHGHNSIFNDLHTMQPGNEIVVYDATGTSTTFVVRETRSYDPTADAATVFISDDSKAHLNLVTCEGTWVSSKESYSQRFVVFADLKQ